MKRSLPALFLLTVFAFVQADPVTVKDFKPAFGKWKGSLTYLDYSSGKPYTMPAAVTISRDKDNDQQLILVFEYPDEPKANGNDTLLISKDGLQVDGALVIAKERQDRGNLKLVAEKTGVDGNENRKAVIRHIYTISRKSFISRKEVRFDGEEKFILRNEYKMSR